MLGQRLQHRRHGGFQALQHSAGGSARHTWTVGLDCPAGEGCALEQLQPSCAEWVVAGALGAWLLGTPPEGVERAPAFPLFSVEAPGPSLYSLLIQVSKTDGGGNGVLRRGL